MGCGQACWQMFAQEGDGGTRPSGQAWGLAVQNRRTMTGKSRWITLWQMADNLWIPAGNRTRENDFARQGQFPVRAIVKKRPKKKVAPAGKWEAEIISMRC